MLFKRVNLYNCFITLLTILLLANGCSYFDYHAYDGRISGEVDVNAHNIAKIEKNLMGKKSITFAMISDTQGWYDETEEVVNAIKKEHF